MRRTSKLLALLAAATLTLGACGGGDPLEDPTDGDTPSDSAPTNGEEPTNGGDAVGQPLVIGSLQYYSSEIIAEIFAQMLEADGYEVQRDYRIGAREVSFPELKAGTLDIFPEYTGPLLKYLVGETDKRGPDEVYEELLTVLPEGLTALNPTAASDQDSYVVTREFADQWGLETIEDLAKVEGTLTMGANSEAETRPNGPKGLKETYGIDVDFTPIEDSGGPLTVQALKSGTIQLAIIYTGDPSIEVNNLVVLQDTKKLFLASHIVPIVSDRVDDKARGLLNDVVAKLTPEELLGINRKSVEDQSPARTIATEWLSAQGLVMTTQ